MPFSKANYQKDVAIVVEHSLYPDSPFTFTFPKKLPKAASEAETRYFGLKEDALPDEHRRALVETVAEMVTTEPEGFDDFPRDERPLTERMREYFDDSSQIELEQILVTAWKAYRASSVPTGYLKTL